MARNPLRLRLVFASYAQSVFGWVLSPIGKSQLNKMIDKGLPEYLRSPILFLLGEKLTDEDRQIVRQIEAIRSNFAKQRQKYVLCHSLIGLAGGGGAPIDFKKPELASWSSRWIARVASVPQYWGTFLYLSANAHRSGIILELGACIGISGAYLASAKYCRNFISVEGLPRLADIAEANIKRIASNATVWHTLFDDALDRILPTQVDSFDLVYIDGHHEKAATLHYFDRLIPHLSDGCLVIFDDVHWSLGMVEAWNSFRQRKGFTCTLDLGRFGIGLWNGKDHYPANFDLFPFTQLWERGRRRFTRRASS